MRRKRLGCCQYGNYKEKTTEKIVRRWNHTNRLGEMYEFALMKNERGTYIKTLRYLGKWR